MSDEDLTIYRVEQLERAVETLASNAQQLNEFMISIRAWMRGIAILYGTIQATILVVIAQKL